MAVVFDGTNDKLTKTSKLFGVVNSNQMTLAGWFKPDAAQTGTIFSGTVGAYNSIAFSIDAPGVFSLFLRGVGGGGLYAATTVTEYDDDAWHHLVISIDLSVPVVSWRIDRTAPSLTVTTAAVIGPIDFGGSVDWSVGSVIDSVDFYDGGMYDFMFKSGVYVDITDSNNLKKFVSSDGRTASDPHYWQNPGPNAGVKPVGYGLGAALALNGEQADIYFSGNFQHNKGTGGAFVLSGAFTEEDDPRVYRSAAHYDTKERWFESELSGWSFTRSRTFIEQREGHPKRGLRMGIDEMDGSFRQEQPSATFSQMIYHDREDDSEEWDR